MNKNSKKIRENILIIVCCVLFIGIIVIQAVLSKKLPNNGINGVLMQGQVLLSILLTVFLRKKGFIASLSLNVFYSITTLVRIIMVDKNISSIPGVISPLITIIVCCIIYSYSQKITTTSNELIEKNKELTETNRIIREKDEKLIYLAYYDILTGLANRQLFVEQIDEMIGNDSNSYFNVVIADIDDFKRIIDAYGHNTGDIVISTYADRLRSYCGQSGFIAKFGEEEFAIIIKNTPDDMDIEEYVDKLRMTLFAPIVVNDTPIQLTMSFGVTEYPAAGKNSGEILRNTDIAVTNAKMTGRGRICFLNQNKYL
ncbi:MAG: GGDEF domain-containing protein [Ruminococcus sp.]|nr:GGDEF domain-containing protein [Ruminococcus sp.]